MSALANKVAFVTGASSEIGRAAAKLFAREGAFILAPDAPSFVTGTALLVDGGVSINKV